VESLIQLRVSKSQSRLPEQILLVAQNQFRYSTGEFVTIMGLRVREVYAAEYHRHVGWRMDR